MAEYRNMNVTLGDVALLVEATKKLLEGETDRRRDALLMQERLEFLLENFSEGLDVRSEAELAQEALDVQDACNLSGVAHSFARAMSRLLRLGVEHAGPGNHPVAVAYADKIAQLTRLHEREILADVYGALHRLAKPDEG